MNSLFDMLTKAGYEAGSIGNDVLPCTLTLGEDPVGFLMGDLSLRLLPEHEDEKNRLQPILTFCTENRGIEQEQGEYTLSRYGNVLFTAAFDYDSCRPVYNVFLEDKEKNRTLLDSSGDKAAAAKAFASRSGLVTGDIPEPVRDAGRIRRFMDALWAKGYQVRESRAEAHRAYDILDGGGREVGYIGRDNRVTITAEDGRDKRVLTDTYRDSNAETLLPGFFERLKERLKEIGMALKVAFTAKGRRYAVHSGRREVATVGEQTHEVTYTDAATAEEKAGIDTLVEEIRMEEARKGHEAGRSEPEKETAAAAAPAISAEEIRRLTGAIFSDRTSAETFLDAVLANPEFRAVLDRRLAGARQIPAGEQERTEHPEEKAAPAKGSPDMEQMKREFDREYSYLQTLFGFNQEKYNAQRDAMVAKFGTASPKEFQAALDAIQQPDSSGSLRNRLETSRRDAERKNVARQTVKEKERA